MGVAVMTSRCGRALGGEGDALPDAEPMLFVDDHEGKALELPRARRSTRACRR